MLRPSALAHLMRTAMLALLLLCTRSEQNERIAALSKQIRASPEDPAAYAARGLAFLELERYAEARTDFRRAVELEANNARYRVLLARALIALGEYDAAQTELFHARIFNPRLQDKYWVKGQLLQKLGRHREAEALFDTSVGIDRWQAEPYIRRGQFLLETGRLEEAARDAQIATFVDSTSAEALAFRARVHIALVRPDSALEDLKRAAQLDSTNPHLLYELAKAYDLHHEPEARNKTLEKALKYQDRRSEREQRAIREMLGSSAR